MLVEMRTRMDGMEQRMNEKAETTTEPEVETVEREESVEDSDDSEAEKGADKAPDVSPNSIRKDLRLMAQATERLAKLQAEDAELEGEVAGATGRGRGRKSGSKMVASDTIKQRIDWPHFYVQRVVAGSRQCVEYADLTVEEFVFGFLRMLAAPECMMDKDTMLNVLEMLMQDAMDYSWKNARGFYEMLGWDVEKRVMVWSDTNRIMQQRMTFSRAVYPKEKEGKLNRKLQRHRNKHTLV